MINEHLNDTRKENICGVCGEPHQETYGEGCEHCQLLCSECMDYHDSEKTNGVIYEGRRGTLCPSCYSDWNSFPDDYPYIKPNVAEINYDLFRTLGGILKPE